MNINPIDSDNNLFQVMDVLPAPLVEKILTTDWLSLENTTSPGQEHMIRRLVNNESIPWIAEWHQAMKDIVWPVLESALPCKLNPYYNGTAFWLDLPGMTCSLHTDGEMPGSLQLYWVGQPNAGTAFYHYKNLTSVRHHFDFCANNGYVMINQEDDDGYRRLQWHAMTNPVPENTYRLTSYTWLNPCK